MPNNNLKNKNQDENKPRFGSPLNDLLANLQDINNHRAEVIKLCISKIDNPISILEIKELALKEPKLIG